MIKGVFSYSFCVFMFIMTSVWGQKYVILSSGFDSTNVPVAPDYALKNAWAALPDKEDAADKTPLKSKVKDNQKEAKADVFFLHHKNFDIPLQLYEYKHLKYQNPILLLFLMQWPAFPG